MPTSKIYEVNAECVELFLRRIFVNGWPSRLQIHRTNFSGSSSSIHLRKVESIIWFTLDPVTQAGMIS
ncbi:uncharacterized protein PHALS_14663 [Plasmopara halstedii]|uniref:Uncharacterized protein n=1 Tax=Plasmopara halstedii TaxID=4781 RepID=A0A0P1ANS2_PLAHL|nr:uncharacterized protein PHALS_14663 [Plasmopara halstedii]CEG42857.1 hypothetical protein PHALS_14663 [Plasmopara halstedii]|eukprot:XP_024579226.1 hypothetical protein PHALS_14663 [Plasmopara halstedii]